MAVRYDYTKLDREDWFSLFFGLTQKKIDELEIDPEEWVAPHNSPWDFLAEFEDEALREHLAGKGYVIAMQHTWVHHVMMALIPVMPAPGWGLSDKNIDEAVRRLLIYQHITEPWASDFEVWTDDKGRTRFWKQRPVTAAEIRKLNGLSVNFSTVTKAEFTKFIMDTIWFDTKPLRQEAKEKVSTG